MRLGEPFGVLAIDADQDAQLGVGVGCVRLDATGVDRRELRVAVAGLGIGFIQGSLPC